MFWNQGVVILCTWRMSGYSRQWGLASEHIKLKMFFMFRLNMLNVFEFLGLERVNPKQDSSLHQSFFKSSKFYVFLGIKLLDTNPEFYVFSFISCDIPLATRLFSAIECFKLV